MARMIKWMMIGSFLFMAVSVALIVLLVALGARVPGSSVLHITFAGPLVESPEPDFAAALFEPPAQDLLSLTTAIRRAADDRRITGLVLDVRSPELGLAQLAEIEEAVAAFRARSKWSLGYLETAGEFERGNAAYALAACADRVILNPAGEVNLVGLAAEVPFIKDTLTRLHIDAHVDQRAEYKNAGNILTETAMNRPHREATKALVDDLQTDLVAHLALRREVGEERVRDWIAKGPHPASDALELGLVDALGFWDEVVSEAEERAGREETLVALEKYNRTGDLYDHGPEVALIYVAGNILRGESSGGSSPVAGSDTVSEAFRAARKAQVRGVLMRVASPGGSYVASEVIRREVEVTRNAGIPVVVSMGDVAASGGYLVSVGADRIVAQPSTITGSIGVVASRLSMRRFMSHFAGITFDRYEAAPHADFFSWLDPPSVQDKARVGEFLDRIYDAFVDRVAADRDLARADAEAVARGRVWSGRAALARKLVDHLGGFATALDELKSLMQVEAHESVTLRLFPEPKGAFELLGEFLSSSARLGEQIRGVARFGEMWAAGGVLSVTPLDVR